MKKINTIDLWTEQLINHEECFCGAFIDGFDGDTIKKYEGAVVAIKRNFGYDKERYAEDSSLNLQREILVSNAYRAIITNGSLNEEQIEGLSDVLNSYIISLLRRTSISQQPQQLVKKITKL